MRCMGSIVDYVDKEIVTDTIFGCDTELYNEDGEFGLKSIQLWNPNEQRYFTTEDWLQSERDIRVDICSQFVDWLQNRNCDTTIPFFNIDFDASQFIYYLVNQSGLIYVPKSDKVRASKLQTRNTFQILETDMNMFKIEIVNANGHIITLMDVANFLTATSLDTASWEWVGERKTEIETKIFPKRASSATERKYAMKDAELTYKLYMKLNEEGVIEANKYVTIAGRTMGHFKDYLKKEWGMTFDDFAYGTRDNIPHLSQVIEDIMRESNRGGLCMAFQQGVFRNAHHIDARSMYPSQCVKDYIPHGPILTEPPKGRKYTTLYFPVCYLELKDDKLPYLQWKRKSQCMAYHHIVEYNPGEFVKDAYLDGTFMVWQDEWGIITECYNVFACDLSKCYYLEMRPNRILKPYVERLYQGKLNNKGTKRYYFKILLNSLYGKFLSRPDGVSVSYEGGERHKVDDTGRKTYYLPLGAWIAMGGRVDLMRAMLSLPKDDVLYCDTDSIIFKGDKFPDVTIGKMLREWGIENDNFDVKVVGPKTYQEIDNVKPHGIPYNPVITKCAGMGKQEQLKLKFDELREGLTVHSLKRKRDPVTWASHLEETEFTISTRASIFRGRI